MAIASFLCSNSSASSFFGAWGSSCPKAKEGIGSVEGAGELEKAAPANRSALVGVAADDGPEGGPRWGETLRGEIRVGVKSLSSIEGTGAELEGKEIEFVAVVVAVVVLSFTTSAILRRLSLRANSSRMSIVFFGSADCIEEEEDFSMMREFFGRGLRAEDDDLSKGGCHVSIESGVKSERSS